MLSRNVHQRKNPSSPDDCFHTFSSSPSHFPCGLSVINRARLRSFITVQRTTEFSAKTAICSWNAESFDGYVNGKLRTRYTACFLKNSCDNSMVTDNQLQCDVVTDCFSSAFTEHNGVLPASYVRCNKHLNRAGVSVGSVLKVICKINNKVLPIQTVSHHCF